METVIYNQLGNESGKITLPEYIFGLRWNSDLVHQVAVSMASSARHPIAHAKTRGEVRGGGKKPWQQKGTGRARHGSSRSPIWVGGGTTHGPRNDKNYDRKVNKKMKAKALFTILSRKFREGEVFFIDSVSVKTAKTKDAVEALSTLSKVSGFPTLKGKRANSMFIALGTSNKDMSRALENVGNISVEECRNISVPAVLKYKTIVFVGPEEVLKTLSSKMDAPLESEGAKPKAVRKTKAAPKAKAAKKVSAQK